MKLNFLLTFLLKPSESHDRCGSVKLGNPGQFPLTSLSSYPGSGNTWVRYLIEEFTGFYTGSIYDDKKLFTGGFKGETENFRDGRVVAIKAHSFREERGLGDAILLIRNPFDAILAEFNRNKGGGDHHTGVATNDDFLSRDWTEMDFGKRAFRWFKLYHGNLVTRRTLPIFYEYMKEEPLREMAKVSDFLNITQIDDEAKIDCLFGENSKKFKRSSERGYDPYNYVEKEKLELINEQIRKLNVVLQMVHGIELPDNYIREFL